MEQFLFYKWLRTQLWEIPFERWKKKRNFHPKAFPRWKSFFPQSNLILGIFIWQDAIDMHTKTLLSYLISDLTYLVHVYDFPIQRPIYKYNLFNCDLIRIELKIAYSIAAIQAAKWFGIKFSFFNAYRFRILKVCHCILPHSFHTSSFSY